MVIYIFLYYTDILFTVFKGTCLKLFENFNFISYLCEINLQHTYIILYSDILIMHIICYICNA